MVGVRVSMVEGKESYGAGRSVILSVRAYRWVLTQLPDRWLTIVYQLCIAVLRGGYIPRGSQAGVKVIRQR